MGSYLPWATVTRVLYYTIDYYMFLYYSVLNATVNSMWQMHVLISQFLMQSYGQLSPLGYSTRVLYCTRAYCMFLLLQTPNVRLLEKFKLFGINKLWNFIIYRFLNNKENSITLTKQLSFKLLQICKSMVLCFLGNTLDHWLT